MELNLLILGLSLGALESIFVYFYGSGAGPWTPFSSFLERLRKKVTKKQKNGNGINAFSMNFRVFPETETMRFEYAGASGLRFIPLIFWLCASGFALPFFHRFSEVFGRRLGTRIHAIELGSAGEAGTLK